LHTVIYDLLHQIMTGRVDRGLNRDLVISLFRDGKLLHRIIEAQQLNDDAVSVTVYSFSERAMNDLEYFSAKPKGVRLGYMGHLTQISEDVINAFAHYPPNLAAILREFAPQPDWNLYVSGRFQETKDRDASLLGGGKPIVTPGQVQALRARLVAAAAAGRGLGADLALDEGDRLPPSGTGRGSGFRSHVNGNGNGIGASPVSTNSRAPHQNVVFSSINDEDEAPGRASGGSNQASFDAVC
jgi:SIT4 phosphatase-associated protein